MNTAYTHAGKHGKQCVIFYVISQHYHDVYNVGILVWVLTNKYETIVVDTPFWKLKLVYVYTYLSYFILIEYNEIKRLLEVNVWEEFI